jgi:hypothetical protein
MSKAKQKPSKHLRAAARRAELADLRDGRRNRASTFVDRRKEASRRACRGNVRFS